jgi:hypothetical protein
MHFGARKGHTSKFSLRFALARCGSFGTMILFMAHGLAGQKHGRLRRVFMSKGVGQLHQKNSRTNRPVRKKPCRDLDDWPHKRTKTKIRKKVSWKTRLKMKKSEGPESMKLGKTMPRPPALGFLGMRPACISAAVLLTRQLH